MKINTAPRSDQWNADDFVGSVAKTFTIADVTEGTAEGARHDIHLAEGGGRVWRPPVTMLRLLTEAWGDESDNWVGKRVTLHRDASVRFGSDTPGGIRISHMSNLPNGKRMSVALTASRGRRSMTTVDPLPDAPPPTTPATKQPTPAAVTEAFKALGVTLDQLETRLGSKQDAWTAADIATLAALGKAIKSGETTTYEEFDPQPEPEGGEAK
jgi:hypothetical protein